MRWTSAGCRRFQRLLSEREDRDLLDTEQQFLGMHRASCPECRWLEAVGALSLNMLREAVLEPEIDPSFDQRVLRRVRVAYARGTWSYWSPALIGAGIACAAILSAFQLLAPSERSIYRGPGEARMYREQPLPTLDLGDRPIQLR